MKSNKEHSNHQTVDDQSKTFFKNGSFHWKRSQSEVWSGLEAKMTATPQTRSLLVTNYKQLAVAASLLILIGLTAFLRFYSETITTPAGIHQLAELPDGTTVELNAQSSLSYHPYWYRISRKLTFEGEGFFNVEKGNRFTVVSASGKTQVLGTSFNILSREDVYAVTCLTGSVKVTSITKNRVILKPNSKAEIQKDGEIKVKHGIETYPEISWRKNIFLFTATPVQSVFQEIERQYGVTIQTDIKSLARYTGNFNKEQNVEDILGYVCPALGLKYMKRSARLYFITQDNE